MHRADRRSLVMDVIDSTNAIILPKLLVLNAETDCIGSTSSKNGCRRMEPTTPGSGDQERMIYCGAE